MSRMEKNTADKFVVMQEVKTLRSRVSVIIWRVRSRFGSLFREVPPTWPTEFDRVDRPSFRNWKDATAGRPGEVSKENQV
jgi:hypothetical protein